MRIRPARAFQRPDAPLRLIAVGARPHVARELREALSHLDEQFDVARAVLLARSGRWSEIARDAIDWVHFREILRGVFGRLGETFEMGATLGVQRINRRFRERGRRVRFGKRAGPDAVEGLSASGPLGASDVGTADIGGLAELFGVLNIAQSPDVKKAVGDRFNFDRFDSKTQGKLRAEQDRLIRELEGQARTTINTVAQDAMRAGDGPEATVSTIRSVIGLTETQAQAVANYRRMLENLGSGALRRQLRDADYDAAFRRAQESGGDLDAELVDEMTAAYEDNYLDHRARTIAGTESVRMSNKGLQDAYQQAIDRGALPPGAIKQFWQVSGSERTCPICLSIPDMNPDGVGIGESFQSIDGPQDAPPDPHPNAVLAGSTFIAYGNLERMVAAEYDGPAILVSTRQNRTTIGPNHPMLTARGMVPAKLLKVGDKLACDLRAIQLAGTFDRDSDLYQVPLVEDAFGALKAVFGHATVATSRDDLHGDAVFCKEEIEVVFPQRILLGKLDSFGVERFREGGLMGANVKLHLESANCPSTHDIHRIFLPAPRSMGGGYIGHFAFLTVTGVEHVRFKGWAFDATTETSLYCSDGLVVSNCECSVEIVTDLDMVPDE